jgi:lipopolysaccharide export system protein LptC
MKIRLYMRFWIALWCGLLTTGCAAKPPVDPGEAPPAIDLGGVGFRFWQGSTLQAVGQAKTAKFLRDTGDLQAHDFRLKVLRSSEEGDVDLEALTVDGNIHTLQAKAQGGVRVSDATGSTGQTARAHLDGRAHVATGDDPVDVTGPDYRIRASAGFQLGLVSPSQLALKGPIVTTIGGKR